MRRQYLALYRDTFRNAAYTLTARLPLKTLHDPLSTPPARVLVPTMPGRSGAYPHAARVASVRFRRAVPSSSCRRPHPNRGKLSGKL